MAKARKERLPRAFTLAELLVVVSIICLMMSFLLPSLNRVQKQAEQVHCLANLHQLYLAWTLHNAASDDQLCPPEVYKASLDSYVPNEDVFYCVTLGRKTGHQAGIRSYGVSNAMGGDFRDGVQPYKRFHEISHPGNSLVFVDTESRMGGTFWPLLRDQDHKRWLWRPPDLMGLGGVTSRHGNGCNMTFADGHGEMIRWKDQRTLGLIKGTVADEVTASDDSADLDYLIRVLVGDRPVQDETEEQEQKEK
jgi:prepilin-type processing-associated H-X9-DG protein/prepilin-type N-terminal cleavage/methylation domain-containing protein